MRDSRAAQETRRAREFEAFAAGAGGRLLHAATLLTAESPADNPRARHLLTLALARTYACWDRLRGEDPYNRAREQLATSFAHGAWHEYAWRLYDAVRLGRVLPLGRGAALGRGRRPGRTRQRPAAVGVLARLTAQERLVLVLRLYEGVAEEQAAALLGLPADRVRTLCDRATTTLLRPPRALPPPAAPRAKATAS
ncbi:RNA polymerase subunit sigma-70 [Streptomyces sp. IBSBF 2953]|uniref:sigma factor-like helix-turn-helix DNA-binding protein n=1 Tax=Streptomyces TaxID=1883 RepID=UPI00211A7D3A|nr:sigma factor-like helix-turn-helix DNA-binding protein [Streptomyces scabiei]MCQ9185832.1 RNA polymerase subunit sigma-70 [Streptomyces hayashii]MDX3116908.1 sigma factor-like helix-turn-helix DNA-binding protein [Streptomyces scabiei]